MPQRSHSSAAAFTSECHSATTDYLKYQVVLEKVMKVPDQAEAIRVFNYPYAALEEVLCNAVFHKSWDDRNPIEVRINPNDIEVFNIEGPMPPLTQKDILRERVASRNYRNRRIGDFLKELHLTEGRSTGFPKIRQALRRNGSPEVVFETDERNSYFLAHLDIHPAFKGIGGTQGGTQSGTQSGTQGGTQGDELDTWIEKQIRKNPRITADELAKMSKKGLRTIKRHIAKLPHIKYVGSGYSGHWVVCNAPS